MAGTSSFEIHKKTVRQKWEPRKKPYFRFVGDHPGLTVGYKRREGKPGLWVARLEIRRVLTATADYPVYAQKAIGIADDESVSNHETILTASEAEMSAKHWAIAAKKVEADSEVLTVRLAVEQERDRKEAAGRLDISVAGRVRMHVLSKPLADIPLADLTRKDLLDWQAGMVQRDPQNPDIERRAKENANRIMTELKAAFNQAKERTPGLSDAAWAKLPDLIGADGNSTGRNRTHHFEMPDVLRLIEHASSKEFARFLEAFIYTGARNGELRELAVRDFDSKEGYLYVRGERLGARKTGAREIPLLPEAVEFFATLTTGREPEAPLLLSPEGDRWPDWRIRYDWIKTCEAAGLHKPDKLGNYPTIYSLRHSYITNALFHGVPIWIVAKNCGNSIEVIERTYLHDKKSERLALTRQFAPTLRPVEIVSKVGGLT
jgi:integrase